MKDWKARAYRNYLTTAFGEISSRSRKKDYVRSNYLKILPKDRKARIMDFGCGRGEFIEALLSHGYQDVEGVEASREMFEYCEEIIPGKVKLFTDGSVYLKDNPNKFDAIVMMDLLEHFEKDGAIELLQLARSALREGGMLILQLPNGDAPFSSVHRYSDLTHELCFSERSIRQALLAADFSRAEVFPLNLPLNTPVRWIQRACQSSVFFMIRMLRVAVGTQNPNIITPCLIAVSYR